MNKGLTILEMLVVIAIIATMAGFVLPNMDSWNCRQNTTNDFNSLSSTVNYLQTLAKNRGRSTLLRGVQDGSKITYSYYQAKTTLIKENCWSQAYSDTIWESIDGSIELDGTLTTDPGLVCFHADGSVNQGVTKVWVVSKTCGTANQLTSYRLSTYGTTGFLEKEKFNVLNAQWEEI